MRDRVPTYPGRVVLTPVAGQPNTYDMTRADEPTQIGDPLNKANLLQDTVAQMFGLFNTSVPNDVFNFLGKFNLHWWMANGYIAPYYTLGESYEDEVGRGGTAGTYSIQYSDSISVNDSGDVSLDNPTSIEIETDFSGQHADKFNQIPTGFFVTSPDFRNGSTVYQKSGDAYETYVSKVWYTYLPLTSVVGHPAILSGESYVYSTERDAYPDDGNVGETYYKYVGVPYENFTHMPVKIEAGSYVGTGTYGSSNPNTLTFSFAPKLVVISGTATNQFTDSLALISGNTKTGAMGYNNLSSGSGVFAGGIRVSWNKNSVSWYVDDISNSNFSEHIQKNLEGQEYYYVALG